MNNTDKDHTVDTPKLGRRNSKTPTSINLSNISDTINELRSQKSRDMDKNTEDTGGDSDEEKSPFDKQFEFIQPEERKEDNNTPLGLGMQGAVSEDIGFGGSIKIGLGGQEDKEQTSEALMRQLTADSSNPKKFMLLQRLFKFIKTRDAPINNVLAGYFFNLINSLLIRRQKLLVHYLFIQAPECIEDLAFHLYNRSIADFVKKLMVISGYDYDDVVAGHIKIKQEWIMKQLVDKLSAEYTEEDNLNSTGMLSELIELKDCFSMISSKSFLADIYEMSFPSIIDSNTSSRISALTVLSKIIRLIPLN